MWNSCTGEWQTVQPLFQGDEASNYHLSSWVRVLIVDEWPLKARKISNIQNPPGGFSVWERATISDTSVIFDGTRFDTMSSAGYDKDPSMGTYSFQVLDKLCNMIVWASDRTGKSHIYSMIFPWAGTDAIKKETPNSQGYDLFQNYPNPFNPSTTISYHLAEVCRVTLAVYDVLGRRVRTLVDARQSPGEHSLVFDGGGLASGVYFYQLRTGDTQQVMKMLLMK